MKILFQGDSITDADRNRELDAFVGCGYPVLVKAELGYENPGKYEFLNRGIGGDRIADIYARIKKDIINLQPDVMSILVGVNDVWHELLWQNGAEPDKYYNIYDLIITEVKEALPNIKIMILEPFVLKARATEENWEFFDTGVKARAVMAKKIAEKHNLPFIPLQEGFDKLCEQAEPSYWLADGVHPTSMGHQYIKTQWLKAFNNL